MKSKLLIGGGKFSEKFKETDVPRVSAFKKLP